MNKDSAIHLKNITKEYPGVVANKKVDFQVNKGEIHALVGENGAGKSTLMKILYGIEQPDEGEILVNGQKQIINKKKIIKDDIKKIKKKWAKISNLYKHPHKYI